MTRSRAVRAHASFAAVITATSLGFVLVQLDVSIVNVALATIGRDLRANVAALQWVVDAYTLSFAALLLTGGAIGDRIGARRAFVAGFIVFVLGSIACGLAPLPAILIAARVVQGIGAALLIPCSLALINHTYGDEPGVRAKAIALWTASGSIALAAGPIAGGTLVESVGWRSIFFVNVPLGVIGLWLARAVHETPTHKTTLDLPGQALAIAFLASLTGAVIGGGSLGWASPLVVVGFVVAVASCAGFIAVELRSPAPMLPLEFFRRAPFSASALVGFAINFSVYGEIFVLSLFWQRVQNYSPLEAGLAFLPFCVFLGVANLLAGSLTAARGPWPAMIAGLAIGAVGFAPLIPVGAHWSYLAMLPGTVIFPFGIGMAVPAMTTALLASVDKQRSGIASGVLNAVRQSAGALGVALLGSLFAVHGVTGVRIGFGVSAMLALLALAVAAAGLRGLSATKTKAKTATR